MAEEERPVHVVVDCTPPPLVVLGEDGEPVPVDAAPRVTVTPLSDEEWAEHRRRAEEHAAAQQAEAEQAAELAASAAEHPDPLVRMLARRAGILP